MMECKERCAPSATSVNAEQLLAELRTRGLTLATAESCTGGNIAHEVTLVPGASDVYRGGVVSYTNEVKMHLLEVEEATLRQYGAVSEPTVREMALGAMLRLEADCAMATSGIAGPGGAVPGKPIGTVCIAVATPETVSTLTCHFAGSRASVITQATARAILMLHTLLTTR